MLHWQVCHFKGPPECDCVSHRKRRRDKQIPCIVLIIAAVLVLICCLPVWVLVVMACTILVALGIVWLCT